MTDTTIPRFFWTFPMRLVREARLDEALADDGRLRILFLWGKDCPNCDVAKGQILLTPERFRWDDVEWLHDNVYEDPRMGTRFGLHGIPAFLVFRGAKKLGRIGQWPGPDAFVATIEKLRAPEAHTAALG
ncbi:thioredoxin family protein [Lysobacter sp. 5GHs7-4]|uniref:thioredoxin family protein n=1 Tax=Lysobacter sp. 5GHs7-4 TaxID=2904253 RepID=UPI001E5F80EE|nr:thioredoxin family protein [Lysobacter sp. 5GHs7-4]UHQ22285.1 thioredoxin family protein [Lysobacter sp. 5GHs7-4]